MKKTLFITIMIMMSVILNSCIKGGESVIYYTYFVGGNIIEKNFHGDLTSVKGQIYKDNSLVLQLSEDNMIMDIASFEDNIYCCGAWISDYAKVPETQPRVWKNGQQENSDFSTKKGCLNKIIALSDKDYLAIGSIDNKGVIVQNGKTIFEYGTAGRKADFKSILLNSDRGLIIVGCQEYAEDGTDQVIKVLTIAGDGTNYSVSETVEYTKDMMKYDLYDYEIMGMGIKKSGMGVDGTTLLCMNRYDKEKHCTGCYSEGNNKLFLLSDTEQNYVNTCFILGMDMYMGGSLYKDGMMKAHTFLNNENRGDCSDGMDKDSEVLGYYYDGINTHLVICQSGKIKIHTATSSTEYTTSDKFKANCWRLNITIGEAQQ